MKKLYSQIAFILWLCLLSFAAQAQEGPDTLSYRAQNDYLLAPLDKSQIPSGILYERVFLQSKSISLTPVTPGL
ncbi:MAG: hypothetical protein EOP51_21965 [Sphingobacteriales bacterium]|nr:MAG: hypothetical protein EOP51_21965 [Sphingobacteriales bacterium]